jgi:hypothetical protein
MNMLAAVFRRSSFFRWCAGFLLLAFFSTAFANTIPCRNAELRIDGSTAVFSADYDLAFSSGQVDALMRGIPLYFVLEWKVTQPRWYWFDKTRVNDQTTFRISYQPLTEKYRLSSGLLVIDVMTLEEAEKVIGRISSRPLFSIDDLDLGTRYLFEIRLRFDHERLPSPFRLNTFGSQEWRTASDWLSLEFVP